MTGSVVHIFSCNYGCTTAVVQAAAKSSGSFPRNPGSQTHTFFTHSAAKKDYHKNITIGQHQFRYRAFPARKQHVVKMACRCSCNPPFFCRVLAVWASHWFCGSVGPGCSGIGRSTWQGGTLTSGVDRGWELGRQGWRILRRLTLRIGWRTRGG